MPAGTVSNVHSYKHQLANLYITNTIMTLMQISLKRAGGCNVVCRVMSKVQDRIGLKSEKWESNAPLHRPQYSSAHTTILYSI